MTGTDVRRRWRHYERLQRQIELIEYTEMIMLDTTQFLLDIARTGGGYTIIGEHFAYLLIAHLLVQILCGAISGRIGVPVTLLGTGRR